MIGNLPRFPCSLSKTPLSPNGFYNATSTPVDEGRWPLAGVPTGTASGLDVLDIDPVGSAWLDQNFDALPLTRAHSTRRDGLHLLFRHAKGLRCSAGRIAPGVDVRAEGGFIIWWPREGLPFEDRPVCEWPNWLIKLAMADVGVIELPSVTPTYPVPTLYQRNYANKALSNGTMELMACPPGGRNNTLNAIAYKMGRLVARGWINRDRVERFLEWGADRCGLTADDGHRSVRATMASGLEAGIKRPYHDIGGEHDQQNQNALQALEDGPMM